MRLYSFVPALALATCSFASLAQDMAPPTPLPSAAQATARIRVIGENGTDVQVQPQPCGEGAAAPEAGLRMREGVHVLQAPDNTSIGIPATSASRSMDSASRVLKFQRKPYYREYTLAAGEPVTVTASLYTANRYCKGSLSLAFTPVAGTDYEVGMTTSAAHCQLSGRRVSASGMTYPLATVSRPASCSAPADAPGQNMMVFLFEAESVYYKLAGPINAAPYTVANDEAFAAAFQAQVQQTASLPGMRACIVMPSLDHHSPLFDRLNAVLDQHSTEYPAIHAEASAIPPAPGNLGAIGYPEAAMYCALAVPMAIPAGGPASSTAPAPAPAR